MEIGLFQFSPIKLKSELSKLGNWTLSIYSKNFWLSNLQNWTMQI